MSQRRLIPLLALIVTFWYLASTFLPQAVDGCLDGTCSFSPGSILISVAIPVALTVVTVLLEMTLFHKALRQALADIGLLRPGTPALRVTLIYLLPLVAFYPLFALLTGTTLSLQSHWGWLVLGVILNNGLNEETFMRGFVFRHVREGQRFWPAAAIATAFFAAYHVPLIFFSGPIIGFTGILTALPTGLLTAYIYERGGNAVFPAALLHVGINSLPFVVVTSAETAPVAGLYLVVSTMAALVVVGWAYRSGFGRASAEVSAPAFSGTAQTHG